MVKLVKNILTIVLSVPVWIYRYAISPYIRPSCRHVPTCSRYMLEALRLHGPFGGFALGLNRILRCRPGGTHGYDPVPLFRFKRYRSPWGLFIRYKTGNRLKR